jgi:anti-sigma B factor antagonist
MPDIPLVVDIVPNESTASRVLRLSGPLTLSNLFEFQSLVRADYSQGTIIDMTLVPYVDSAGIGSLIGAHVSHQRNGRKFALVGVNDRVLNVLKITHVENVFSIHNSVEEAIAATRAANA